MMTPGPSQEVEDDLPEMIEVSVGGEVYSVRAHAQQAGYFDVHGALISGAETAEQAVNLYLEARNTEGP